MPKRAFISFDYDHDWTLKEFLVGQSRHPDTPFVLADWSVKDHIPGDWRARVRDKIRRVDVVIVLCGRFTNHATGVAEELRITQQEGKPYFLLAGYADQTCMPPAAALPSDKMYKWTWDNLKALLEGKR